jgi:hypothetical protein
MVKLAAGVWRVYEMDRQLICLTLAHMQRRRGEAILVQVCHVLSLEPPRRTDKH